MIFLSFPFNIFTQYLILVCVNGDNESNRTSHFVESNSTELGELAELMFEEYWQLHLLNSPETATILGEHRYNDRLDSYSLKSYDKEKVMLNEFLERANQMLPLAPEGSKIQNNLQLFVSSLQTKLDYLMSGSYLFPVTILQTPEMLLRHLMKYHKLNETKQYENLIERYRAMGKQIDEFIELMEEGIRTNFTLNSHSLPPSRDYKNQSIEKSAFYEPFLNISVTDSLEKILAIQSNASDVLKNSLFPAFQKLDDFIQHEYLPNSRPGVGVSSLPNGEEYYKQVLSYHLTDPDVTPAEIHQMGLQEVARIATEMNEVIKTLGLNHSHKDFNEYLRQDDLQHFQSEDEALETYREVLENVIQPKLVQLFKFIPGKKLAVESVPKEIATGAGAYYMMPSPDNSTPGTFFLDTTDLKSIAKYDVMTLSLHEGVPGHHFQHAYVMEQNDLPDFRKYGLFNSAYVEGWALYAEYLGYELRLFEDPYVNFGHLNYEMFRACRLVVDTGIHVLGWDRQRAIEYMMNNTAFSLEGTEREVDRYISWPGQACSYKYGEIKLKQLRRKAESELGDAFDIKEFHDIILRNQAPLAIIEKEIERYIFTVKSNGIL